MVVTNLKVYKKAHLLTLKLYELTSMFPKDEVYGLISQIRRAAISINSNLVEGAARKGISEFRHFVTIARGSAAELRYQILLSKDLKYLDSDNYNIIDAEIEEILKMLSGLLNKSNH